MTSLRGQASCAAAKPTTPTSHLTKEKSKVSNQPISLWPLLVTHRSVLWPISVNRNSHLLVGTNFGFGYQLILLSFRELIRLKALELLFWLRHCLSKPKLPFLGLLITFVNNFQFNWNICIFVYQSSVVSKLDLNQVTSFYYIYDTKFIFQ